MFTVTQFMLSVPPWLAHLLEVVDAIYQLHCHYQLFHRISNVQMTLFNFTRFTATAFIQPKR